MRPGRRNDNRIAERASGAQQCFETRGIDAIVIGEKKLHLGKRTSNVQRSTSNV
jgi:hypothetical protein